jgi:hypothetical protein
MLPSRRDFLATSLLLAGELRASDEVTPFRRAESAARSCRFPIPRGLNESGWPAWLEQHDREIRFRLRAGEEDSLVNFILFGVSFTQRPRVNPQSPEASLIEARVRDFLRAAGSTGANERITILRDLLPRESEESWIRQRISAYLDRRRQYARVLDRAGADDPVASHLYKDRGLSIDTNFRPNFAIETALAAARRRGTLKSVQRAAIIGPGLDFTDKDSGYDYYPLQTLQPFAVVDSLARLGLSTIADLRVTVFDISPQTLAHVRRATGKPYTIQLVLDRDHRWDPGALEYWRQFGSQIGSTAQPLPAPKQIGNLERRALRIPPNVVGIFEPRDLNIVTAHTEVRYDLIVGTNVFVYYDAFDQALAMLNLEAMLKPGGVLLTNTRMPGCATTSLHLVESEKVRYSDTPGDDDQIDTYLNSALRRSLPPA